MALLAFDPARLDSLRTALIAGADDLQRVRSDDSATADAMRAIRAATRTLGDEWLPRVTAVLRSTSMSAPAGSTFDPLWEVTQDPGDGGGLSVPRADGSPELPGRRSFGEVLAAIKSGALVPMASPIDANGRALARYTSISIAPGYQREVGHADLTSNLLKVLDLASDVLPIGWRENHELKVIYLHDARVVSTVHVLTAFDRDLGPEVVPGQSTEAIVSGYLVLRQSSSRLEVNVKFGSGDPTQSGSMGSAGKEYSGAFYPESPPDFEPSPMEPRYVNPAEWTFTTSAGPIADGWGTWKT